MTPCTSLPRRALTLPETLVAIAVIALLLAAALTTSAQSRRAAHISHSLANLHTYASGTSFYAADNNERVWAFSWRAGHMDTPYPDLRNAPSDGQAAANQAIEIIRRRGNRPEATPIFNWFLHSLWPHLVLADYLGERIPARFAISPADTNRLLWARDPQNFLNLPSAQRPSGNFYDTIRWPYSSSYELTPAFFSPNRAPTLHQHGSDSHAQFSVTGAVPFGRRTLNEVAFPAHKVMVHATADRYHADRQIYFAYREARVPLMLADGSAAVRATATANRGFQPASPTLNAPTLFMYRPQLWEPPTLSGAASQQVTGHYRWTREGLRGRDFDAPEVTTP